MTWYMSHTNYQVNIDTMTIKNKITAIISDDGIIGNLQLEHILFYFLQ